MAGLALGDIVAVPGRSLRLMVVSIEPPYVIVAYKDSGKAIEKKHQTTSVILLSRSPYAPL